MPNASLRDWGFPGGDVPAAPEATQEPATPEATEAPDNDTLEPESKD